MQQFHTDGLIPRQQTVGVFRWFHSYKCCNSVFKSAVTYSKHTAFARHPAFSNFLQLSSGFTLTKLEVPSLRVFSGFLLTDDEMPSLGITQVLIFPVVSHFCWSTFIRNMLRLHAYRCWSPASVSEQAPFIASESFAASSLDFPSEWLQFRNRGGWWGSWRKSSFSGITK